MFKKDSLIKILTVLLSVLLLASCGANNEKVSSKNTYVLPAEISNINSGVLAENEKSILSWDMENGCVMLKNKVDGTIWSTIPYGYLSGEKSDSRYVNDNLCSSLQIKYIDKENHVENDLNSNSDADYVMSQRLKTGIRLTYFFEKPQISVPISYRLEDDGVSVSIETASIGEKENKIYQISLLPFFASAQNNTDSYIFVPSGSGALMYVDAGEREPRMYSEPVYGEDAGNQGIYRVTENEKVKMPVFGAKNNENAVLGIITSGAETADITAYVGEERFGYSGVYATFNLRGKAAYNIKGNANTNNRMVNYSEDIVAIGKATVRYVMLDKEDSDYNGMAKYYRNYLIDNGMKEAENIPNAMLTLLGGVKVRRLALGIPYYSLQSLTDFSQAKNIVEDIYKDTNANIAVNLKGFTENGLDSGKYAGGFEADKIFGGKKGLREFTDWCKSQNIDSFFDFDTVFFTEDYKNFEVKNAAKSANDIRAKYSDYDIVKSRLNESNWSYLVDRYSLALSASSLISAADKLTLSGVGLSTLSNVAFSDFTKPEYYNKAHMSNDVKGILEVLNKKKIKTFGEAANDYAASRLDYVFDSPTGSSKLYSLDEDIPFYQMVFRGYTGLSGAVINYSDDAKTEFLNSMLSGTSLAFTLTHDSATELAIMSKHSAVGTGVYSGIDEDIKNYLKEAKPLYELLGNATADEYVFNNDIAQMTFSNGVKVIVNFSEKAVETEFGVLEGKSFTYSGKAGS